MAAPPTGRPKEIIKRSAHSTLTSQARYINIYKYYINKAIIGNSDNRAGRGAAVARHQSTVRLHMRLQKRFHGPKLARVSELGTRYIDTFLKAALAPARPSPRAGGPRGASSTDATKHDPPIINHSRSQSASESRIYLRSPPGSVPGVRGAVLLLGDEELADLPRGAKRGVAYGL